jgi:hydroxylaminobenzene mutase
MNDLRRRLMWHGAVLFLLGLLAGFAMPAFANVRMGLSAHLEGVMNGILLLALGAVWEAVRLSPRLDRLARGAALFGTYANFTTTTLAAAFGTGSMTPVAAPDRQAAGWQEGLVSAGFVSVGLAMLLVAVLLVVGLRGGARR